jgi:hypothetical protein
VKLLDAAGFDCVDVAVVVTLRGHRTLRCIAKAV